MAQAAILYNSFNGGIFSPDMYARADITNYDAALEDCKNYIAMIQGPLRKRSGTRYIKYGKYQARDFIWIPFEYSRDDSYMLEVGHQYIRFFRNDEALLDAADTIVDITKNGSDEFVIEVTGHGYSNGQEIYIDSGNVTELVNGFYFVAQGTTNTFKLARTAGGSVVTYADSITTYSSGGTSSTIYEISTTWDEDDLPNLKYTQDANQIYFALAGSKPRVLTRGSTVTSFSLDDYDFIDGPYETINNTATTMTPNATTGSVTITASTNTFASTDVGRWVRIKISGAWGAAKITTYTNATTVTAAVDSAYPMGGTTASTEWRLGLWHDTTYPRAVEFFQNRLWWFTNDQIDGTYSGSYSLFSPTEPDASTNDSTAVQRVLGARSVNIAEWAIDIEDALVVGTKAGEWIIRANTLGEAITQTNVNATRAGDFGCAPVQGLRISGNIIFVQRTKRMLAQLAYDIQRDGYQSTNLNLTNTEINDGFISQIAYQSHPENYIWALKEDNSVSILSYDPTQEVRGWQNFETDGTVFAIGTSPSATGKADRVWFGIKRNINGSTVRTIEYLEDIFDSTKEQEDSFFVDCGLTFDNRSNPAGTLSYSLSNGVLTVTSSSSVWVSGNVGDVIEVDGKWAYIKTYNSASEVEVEEYEEGFPTTASTANGDWTLRANVSTLTNLHHLEGKTLNVVGDGAVLEQATVENGAIELSEPSSYVHVGLPFEGYFRTLRHNAGAADGTAMGKIKRFDQIVFRFHRSLGGQFRGIGADFWDEILEDREPDDLMDRVIPLYSGDTEPQPVPDIYNQNGQIEFRHTVPLPSMVVGIMPKLVTQDGR
jgi:hypothetical protein